MVLYCMLYSLELFCVEYLPASVSVPSNFLHLTLLTERSVSEKCERCRAQPNEGKKLLQQGKKHLSEEGPGAQRRVFRQDVSLYLQRRSDFGSCLNSVY